MGQEYSHEQQNEFQQFRRIFEDAIRDTEPFAVFRENTAKVTSYIVSKHPLHNKNVFPVSN